MSASNYPTLPAASSQKSTSGPYVPMPAQTARRPRGYLQINGQNILLTELTVTSATHFGADSWTAETGLFQHPQGLDLAFWDKLQVPTKMKAFYGLLAPGQKANEFPTAGNSSLAIVGVIDTMEFDRAQGIVRLSGRDETAVLIDNKTANRYFNVTASDAVTLIAKQFGFTPNVTATTTPVGKLESNSYSTMTNSMAYWDFIIFLAQQENFDAYISNGVLYFGPPEADTDAQPWVWYLNDDGKGRLNGNVYEMTLTRSLNLSRDVTVTVLSHSSKTGKSLVAYASKAGTRVPTSSRSGNANTTSNYIYRRPGLSQIQAQNLANAKLAEISKFEREYSVTLEGDPGLTVRKMTIIRGTNTSFDTNYYIKSISKSWDRQGGFTMRVEGVNVPPANDGAAAP